MKHNDTRAIAFEGIALGPFAYLHQVVVGNGYSWRKNLADLWSHNADHINENTLTLQNSQNSTEAMWLIEPEVTQGVRQYSPLNQRGLLGRFFSLKPELNEIKRFANQYGLLGHKLFLIDPSLKEQTVCSGESLEFWHKSINHIKLLETLWQLIKKKDEQNLAEYIFWKERGERTDRHVSFEALLPYGGAKTTIIASEHIKPELLMKWKFGDLISPASFFVHSEINSAMHGHVSPAVLPFHQGQIFMIPDCLLSSLYSLFALEVSGRRNPDVKCKGCEVYFQPARTDQVYHSKKCRKLHYWHNAQNSPKNRKKSL